jgi:hypothetical protein
LLNHCSWISLLIRLVLFIQHGDSYWMKVIISPGGSLLQTSLLFAE